MENWKQKPGLDKILCRQVAGDTQKNIRAKEVQEKYNKEAYTRWIQEEKTRDYAARAIQEQFHIYMNKYNRFM